MMERHLCTMQVTVARDKSYASGQRLPDGEDWAQHSSNFDRTAVLFLTAQFCSCYVADMDSQSTCPINVRCMAKLMYQLYTMSGYNSCMASCMGPFCAGANRFSRPRESSPEHSDPASSPVLNTKHGCCNSQMRPLRKGQVKILDKLLTELQISCLNVFIKFLVSIYTSTA